MCTAQNPRLHVVCIYFRLSDFPAHCVSYFDKHHNFVYLSSRAQRSVCDFVCRIIGVARVPNHLNIYMYEYIQIEGARRMNAISYMHGVKEISFVYGEKHVCRS